MELRPSLKMGKSKCAKSPISYLTTAPPEFETFKLLLMAVALPYKKLVIDNSVNNMALFIAIMSML